MFSGKAVCLTFLFLTLAASGPGATLTVTVDGAGTVSPNLNGQDLQLGKIYTVNARPAAGYLFAGWTGSLPGKAASLSFVMQEGLALQANFVPNPFIARKGIYTGLYSVPDAPLGTVAGGITITTTDRGTFTGSLIFLGKKVAFTGQFNLSGTAAGFVLLAPTSPAVLTLDLLGGPGVTGSISNGTTVAVIRADRAGFSPSQPAPYAGKYTMIVPGTAGAGDGYAAVTVDPIGRVKVAGKLADGTAFTQSAAMASDGSWPFFVSLYKGGGMAWGWLSFTNREQTDVDGLLTWVRPGPAPSTASNMVVTASGVQGSRYTASPGRVLNFSDGLLTLSGGGLAQPFPAAITLTANNQVLDNTALNGTGIRLRTVLKTTTGIFTGSLTPPAFSHVTRFEGAVFQKGNFGSGFFLNGGTNGQVTIEGLE